MLQRLYYLLNFYFNSFLFFGHNENNRPCEQISPLQINLLPKRNVFIKTENRIIKSWPLQLHIHALRLHPIDNTRPEFRVNKLMILQKIQRNVRILFTSLESQHLVIIEHIKIILVEFLFTLEFRIPGGPWILHGINCLFFPAKGHRGSHILILISPLDFHFLIGLTRGHFDQFRGLEILCFSIRSQSVATRIFLRKIATVKGILQFRGLVFKDKGITGLV